MPQASTTASTPARTAAADGSNPRSTERGLALLRVVADHAAGLDGDGGLALADAARAVGLSASTALRQLRSLESAGFVDRNDEGRYLPGQELLRIARLLAGNATLPRLAEPILAELAEATGESAYLAEPADAQHAVYIALAHGHHAVRHVSWLGTRVPRRSSAVGAALAGRTELHGAAIRTDAVEPGVTAVSAPVHDANGRVVAAISLVGPSYRLEGAALTRAEKAVSGAAGRLGATLGAPQGTSARTGK